jgi:hypothetical protein
MPEPSQSDFGNIRRSRFGDLLRLGTSPRVMYQMLQQLKRWPGGNQAGGDGENERVIAPAGGLHVRNPDDPQYWDGTGLPSAAYRQNFRKRYLSSTCYWNQEGVSYTESSTRFGAGYAPITNGSMPTGISNDHPPIKSGSETRPFKFPIHSSTAIGSSSNAINEESYGWTTSDFRNTDDTRTYEQFYGYSYGTEMPFATVLGVATSRLALRHFPTTFPTVTNPEQSFSEWFDEYGVTRIGDTNPAHYTGNPTGAGFDQAWMLPPIHSVNNHERLQSFWGVPTSENWQVGGVPVNPANGGATPVIATRTRFFVDQAVSYWIAKARWMDAIYSGGPISSGRIVDVSFLYDGIAFPGEPVEIPVHPDDGDAKGTHGGLSCGALCFAILEESPAAWSARTGIPI